MARSSQWPANHTGGHLEETGHAGLVPGLSHRAIEGSHWPQLDMPDDFNRLLDDLLAQVR